MDPEQKMQVRGMIAVAAPFHSYWTGKQLGKETMIGSVVFQRRQSVWI